jgi:hypothetical protein
VGYGFNSNGRYAQSGILRDRFIPRLNKATPESLLDDNWTNFDPFKDGNEKPGGHGERAVAVGVVDMAIWGRSFQPLRPAPVHQKFSQFRR